MFLIYEITFQKVARGRFIFLLIFLFPGLGRKNVREKKNWNLVYKRLERLRNPSTDRQNPRLSKDSHQIKNKFLIKTK